MADVFISYAGKDRPRVKLIASALEDAGFIIWWDRNIIPPRQTLYEVIEREFDEAKCVLALWSKGYIESSLVEDEALIASRRGILLPVMIEKIDVPIGFSRFQNADLSDWVPGSTHGGFNVLVNAISAMVEGPRPSNMQTIGGKSPVMHPEMSDPAGADIVTSTGAELDGLDTGAFGEARPPMEQPTMSAPAKAVKVKSKGTGLGGVGTAMVEGAVAVIAAIPKMFKIPGKVFSKEKPSQVHLGASVPSALRPGGEFTARFVAYVADVEEAIDKKLRELSPRSTSHLGIKRCQWKPDTKVTVSLSGTGIVVDQARQPFVWDPPHVIVDFDAQVSPDASFGTTVIKFDVFIDEIRVAKLRIDLQITDIEKSDHINTATTRSLQSAFASYSSKDEKRVTDRLASLEISAGMDVFYARKSMKPGDEWKSRLQKEILNRDQFLLFWSQAAADSKWVKWEWQLALNEKGKQDMQIHPLQSDVAPPDELSDLHFSDIYMIIRESADSPENR